jgi:Fur family ferric uptake transcriptional regulator
VDGGDGGRRASTHVVTQSPQVERRTFADIDEVVQLLREAGHRVTAPCRVVLQALFAADGPVSAQFIADHAGATSGLPLELTSVYRNLERLESLGAVQHVHLGHGPGLYTLVGTGDLEFLTCERCHRVTVVDPSELDPVRAQIRDRFGYEARFGHFPIVGLCAECAGAPHVHAH